SDPRAGGRSAGGCRDPSGIGAVKRRLSSHRGLSGRRCCVMKTTKQNALKRFMPYLMAYPSYFITAMILGVVAGGTSVFMTWQIGRGIDRLIGAGQVDFAGLRLVLFQFASVVLLTVLSQLLIQRLGNRVAYLSAAALRKEA